MQKGEAMSVIFLFLCGLILSIGGVYFYITRTSSDYEKFIESVNDIKIRLDKSEENLKAVIKELYELDETRVEEITKTKDSITDIKKEFEVMSIRQKTLEKKLSEIPKDLSVKFSTAVPVRIINEPKKKAPLLERAGVIKEKKK